MSEIRTRCTQGKLIVNDQYIRIELGQLKQQTLLRSALTAIDSKMAFPSIFGFGATNLIFHGQGVERLQANFVKTSVARDIKSMLGF